MLSSCNTSLCHFLHHSRNFISLNLLYSSESSAFFHTCPFPKGISFTIFTPSLKRLPLQVIWYTIASLDCINVYPFNKNLLNKSESSNSIGANNFLSCPCISKKSVLYIIQGANIPLVVLSVFSDSHIDEKFKNSFSLNSSGSNPKSWTYFSGPGGCSGGSILVADTTVFGFKCFTIFLI